LAGAGVVSAGAGVVSAGAGVLLAGPESFCNIKVTRRDIIK